MRLIGKEGAVPPQQNTATPTTMPPPPGMEAANDRSAYMTKPPTPDYAGMTEDQLITHFGGDPELIKSSKNYRMAMQYHGTGFPRKVAPPPNDSAIYAYLKGVANNALEPTNMIGRARHGTCAESG